MWDVIWKGIYVDSKVLTSMWKQIEINFWALVSARRTELHEFAKYSHFDAW